ncbi:hypothetical protein CDL15_Pgr011888 [Punica granatum]|uniref:Uncharacterized protein n=1 Tax=Punica granatum TaxID=22663 RepID=A0A218XNE0_PUNGR|nr:hypothetical protein CDL15_Pgr011888 [Punica granatum]
MLVQSILKLFPAFLLVKWDPQLSQAKPSSRGSTQSHGSTPQASASRNQPRLFPLTGGSMGFSPSLHNKIQIPLTPITSYHFPIVSTPFWPTGFPHKDSRLKLGTLFIARQSEANRRARGHEQ